MRVWDVAGDAPNLCLKLTDGEYRLGRQTVHKRDGGVRLADGTLAGSTLTMDQALRNLVGLGLPLAEASRRTSTLAARYLGLDDRGAIAAGAWADLVVLDAATLRIEQVVIEGEAVDPVDPVVADAARGA